MASCCWFISRCADWLGVSDAGVLLNFDQVVEHLRLLASGIAGAESDGPQPEICVLDVTTCSR